MILTLIEVEIYYFLFIIIYDLSISLVVYCLLSIIIRLFPL